MTQPLYLPTDDVLDEYRRIRHNPHNPVRASEALRAARWIADVRRRWQEAEDRGVVRFRVEPDDMALSDLLDYDCGHTERGLCDRCRDQTTERVDHEGVNGVVAEILVDGVWDQYTAAVWGFIGDDWEDDLADLGVKGDALDRLDAYELEQRAEATRYSRMADAAHTAARLLRSTEPGLCELLDAASATLRCHAADYEDNL